LTRRAIQALRGHGLKVAILTKAGALARRDFDLLTDQDMFGTTLVFTDEMKRQIWEPGAAPTRERIKNMEYAKAKGIQTFVSLEPVFYFDQTLELIRITHDFVDHYKVGKLNYIEREKTMDWKDFAERVMAVLDEVGANYYIKKDLAKFVGRPDGIRRGDIPE
jgi:DNA repair photolyase